MDQGRIDQRSKVGNSLKWWALSDESKLRIEGRIDQYIVLHPTLLDPRLMDPGRID